MLFPVADDSPTGSLMQTQARFLNSVLGGRGGEERNPWNPPPCLTTKPSIQPKDPTVQGTSLKEAVSRCVLGKRNLYPSQNCLSKSRLADTHSAKRSKTREAWLRLWMLPLRPGTDIARSSPGRWGGLPVNSLVRVTRQKKAQWDELRKWSNELC